MSLQQRFKREDGRWFGHVKRSNECYIANKVAMIASLVIRKRGQPRIEEDIVEDLDTQK